MALLLGERDGTWWRCAGSAGSPSTLEAAQLAAPPVWAKPQPQWGPVMAAGRWVAAADDALIAAAPDGAAEGKVSWRYDLAGRQPIGVAAAKERLVVAFADGGVVELDARRGSQQAAWHAGQPLAFGPLLTPRGIVLATADGCLLLWPRKTRP